MEVETREVGPKSQYLKYVLKKKTFTVVSLHE